MVKRGKYSKLRVVTKRPPFRSRTRSRSKSRPINAKLSNRGSMKLTWLLTPEDEIAEETDAYTLLKSRIVNSENVQSSYQFTSQDILAIGNDSELGRKLFSECKAHASLRSLPINRDADKFRRRNYNVRVTGVKITRVANLKVALFQTSLVTDGASKLIPFMSRKMYFGVPRILDPSSIRDDFYPQEMYLANCGTIKLTLYFRSIPTPSEYAS